MLVFDSVSKSFGGVRALDGLSIRIEPGEVFGLLGPNGAGKTTSISLAVGLLRPDAGRITLEGIGPPHRQAARAALGVAPQSLAIYDDLTARENLELFAGLFGMTRRERRGRAGELLERVGLDDRAGHRVAGFSGGMKRRLNLAAALVHRPRLILLDEPTAGVDPQSRNALFDILRGLRDDAITVVYTTHYMEEAQRLCDRVAIIDRGRLLAMDTVGDLISRFAADRDPEPDQFAEEPKVAMAGAGMNAGSRSSLSGSGRGAGTGGAMAASGSGDLESVFLELTGRTLRD
ncbi:MAG: ABC transporter ATP-binding protein [Planctomycetota bacterium]